MKLLKKLLSKLSGYAYPQEYLCLSDKPFTDTLFAYIVSGDSIVHDITHHHLFVGYCPLVFAFSLSDYPKFLSNTVISIRFSRYAMLPGTPLPKRKAVASLELRFVKMQDVNGHTTCYYEGNEGHHRFLPAFNQLMVRLNNRLYQQKTGNVYLDDKLYPQVQIAYSLPRTISLISLQLDNNFNLFPTDLHGQINSHQYIVSLRHEGMAREQIEKAGRIVISTVEPSLYKEVYKLGKNHMQPPKAKDDFIFSNSNSKILGLPLPIKTTGYRELELLHSFTHGIHQMLLFSILHHQPAEKQNPKLCHVHNSYATWRHKHQLTGNYLLR